MLCQCYNMTQFYTFNKFYFLPCPIHDTSVRRGFWWPLNCREWDWHTCYKKCVYIYRHTHFFIRIKRIYSFNSLDLWILRHYNMICMYLILVLNQYYFNLQVALLMCFYPTQKVALLILKVMGVSIFAFLKERILFYYLIRLSLIFVFIFG